MADCSQLRHCAVGQHGSCGVPKQADASGKPTLKTYDLVERLASAPDAQKAPAPEYVTRKEFDALAALVGEIKGKKKRKVEEEDDDE